jgi:hypothetical protein
MSQFLVRCVNSTISETRLLLLCEEVIRELLQLPMTPFVIDMAHEGLSACWNSRKRLEKVESKSGHIYTWENCAQ